MAIRFGTSGDETIVALQSTDTLVGLDGNDTYDFSQIAPVIGPLLVLEDAGGGTDTIITVGDAVLPDFVENLTLAGSADRVLTGNALDNRIEGNVGADTLDGGAGNDTLVGGGGNDVYLVDSAKDVVIEAAGGGIDEVRATVSAILAANVEKGTLVGGSAATGLTGNVLDNTLVGNQLANVIDGAAGNDTLTGNDGNDTLRGGDGNDSIDGGNGNDSIDGGNGNDTLLGAAGDDRVLGGAANDSLSGGAGNDTLTGGLGNDTYVLAAGDGNDAIVETAAGGVDTVQVDSSILSFTAAAGIEVVIVSGGTGFILTGNAVANTLIGGSGNDRIDGLAGNDAIDGGAGADTMIGGLGNDQYTLDNAGDQVIELAGAGSGNDRVFSSIADYTLPANVERLMLVAGSAALTGTGNSLDNIIDGNEADNRLVGGAGNDWLDGHAGNDTLVGGIGNDTFVVDAPGDTIIELANGGNDVVRVAVDITYTMADGIESAVVIAPRAHVVGNRAANLVTGGAGGDVLDGGRGIDTLAGGTGSDTYFVDNAADAIVEGVGAGVDTIFATAAYTMPVNVEKLILVGSAGAISGTGNAANDAITGNGSANLLAGLAGNDTLSGLGGDDTLQGGEGNDVLDGGTGVNSLEGGNGDDTYIVNSSSDSIADSGGHDLVIAQYFQSDLTNYTFFDGVLRQVQIEDLQLAEGNTILNGAGNSFDNRITGNSQNNQLNGREGNDFIDGGAGNDTMIGGVGNDTFVVSDAGDRVTENAGVGLVPGGTDTIWSDLASYSLSILANPVFQQNLFVENLVYRGQSNATLTGNALNNVITGGTGNDSIDGGSGADTMIGGAGNDTYTIDNAGDVFTEAAGGGNDKVIYGVANAGTMLTVDLGKTSSAGVIGLLNVENVTITGTGLYNINGTAGDNVLIGNASVNVITGGAGNDFIDGGGAADSMTGGAGNDTYVVSVGNGASGGQVAASEDVVTELANGGRDVVVLAFPPGPASSYTLPDFVEDLQGTVANAGALTFSGNAVDNAIDLTLANGGTVNPGLGVNDSVTVRGFASGSLTVTDTDGTDFVALLLSNLNGTGTLNLATGVNDIRFNLQSGSSNETANFADTATVLISGAGSLGLASATSGKLFSNAYSLTDFTGTLTFGATGTANTDAIALHLQDVQGGLATTNTAVDRFDLDSQGSVANSLAVGGVSFPGTSHPGFVVTGETTLDLTAIGNTGFEVGLNGFTGAQLGLAAQTAASAQDWLVRTDGSATELALAAGADANVLTIDTTGTGGESVLSVSGASASGTINLAGNQGLTLLGISGGTVNSSMSGAGVVLRLGFDGATNFTSINSVDTVVTGSGGADHFVYGTTLDSNDAVDGGAGSDSLTATLAATTGNSTVVVAPTIASVESMALTVLGNYVLDAEAIGASNVTVTGGGSTVLPNGGGTFAFSFSVENGRGTWDASGYNVNNSFNFTAAADANGVTVTGGAGIGSIVGSSGNDIINPGGGNGGSVTGGAGSDTFVFSKTPTGLAVPTVKDYVVGDDHIALENAVMAAIGSPGALNPALFSTFVSFDGTTNTQAGVLKYCTSNGTLYYDADGTGAGGIKDVGIFLKPDGTPAALTAADITVI